MRIRIMCGVLIACAGVQMSASGPDVPIPTRAREAQRIVVATVIDQRARFHVNPFGDRLIVTDTLMQVDETLKGPREPVVQVTIEGGSIGDLTLHVSDLPALQPHDRAILFLDRETSGDLVPHGRGLGLLKLDAADRVAGSSLTLSDVRGAIRAAVR